VNGTLPGQEVNGTLPGQEVNGTLPGQEVNGTLPGQEVNGTFISIPLSLPGLEEQQKSLTVKVESGRLMDVKVVDNQPLDIPLPGGKKIELPYGIISFDLEVNNPGESTTVSLAYPYNPNIMGYIKKIDDQWFPIEANVRHDPDNNQTIISFTLVDGGVNDADGRVNGVIKDPGGPYIPQPQPSVTVPLSPLALGFLAALFGFAGSRKIRRN
ncbi:hypothetical protein SAMN05660197_0437, partial [Nitratiruptor tergarcus DSM 16512]